MKVVVVILAGGRSTRFGSEKAVALVDGAPMIARVAAVLREGGAPLAVNAPEASGAAAWAREQGLPVLPDAPGSPDGPLAGVLAGLQWAQSLGAEVLVTSPCDTPGLPHDMVRRLLEELAERPAATAVASDGSHPLCTAWCVSLLPRLREALSGGHPPVRAWLGEVGAVEVRFDDARAFHNMNHRADGRLSGALDAASAVMLTLLAWIGVFFILFVFNFGDAMTEEGRRRAMIEGRVAAVACLVLAILCPIVAVRLVRRAGASRRR